MKLSVKHVYILCNLRLVKFSHIVVHKILQVKINQEDINSSYYLNKVNFDDEKSNFQSLYQ